MGGSAAQGLGFGIGRDVGLSGRCQTGEITRLPPQRHHAAMFDQGFSGIDPVSREQYRRHFQQ